MYTVLIWGTLYVNRAHLGYTVTITMLVDARCTYGVPQVTYGVPQVSTVYIRCTPGVSRYTDGVSRCSNNLSRSSVVYRGRHKTMHGIVAVYAVLYGIVKV